MPSPEPAPDGRIVRVRRGVYRLVHLPATEREELVVLWLWSDRAGVFSHETALALHELSDVLPAKVYMTLPEAWRRRRLRVPDGLVLHHADVGDRDREWLDTVPLTSPQRTLQDCIDAHLSPELVEQAIRQARERGCYRPRRRRGSPLSSGPGWIRDDAAPLRHACRVQAGDRASPEDEVALGHGPRAPPTAARVRSVPRTRRECGRHLMGSRQLVLALKDLGRA